MPIMRIGDNLFLQIGLLWQCIISVLMGRRVLLPRLFVASQFRGLGVNERVDAGLRNPCVWINRFKCCLLLI
jgi:hypothetical protein